MTPEQKAVLLGRVDNWSRWASGGSGCGGTGRCGSAEGRFVREALDEEARAGLAEGKVDVDDAETVEKALCAVMYVNDRQFFVLYYVKRWQKALIAREINIDADMVDGFRDAALRRLAEVLIDFDSQRSMKKRQVNPSRKGLGAVRSTPTTSRVSTTEH